MLAELHRFGLLKRDLLKGRLNATRLFPTPPKTALIERSVTTIPAQPVVYHLV